jgi:transcriptional regulator with XRE-family HTH domain
LAGQIESQLREAYQRRFDAGELNQSTLASKLGVGRSVIHRRLNGQTNMTIETIAEMAWALDLDVDVRFDNRATPSDASNCDALGLGAPVDAKPRSHAKTLGA